ncbi:lipase 3-like [Euwallacea similis]|uniref:lipase 3-like n=1 Tax=Euwallacea similis TaxID=1736056 RepID=UPI00344B4490
MYRIFLGTLLWVKFQTFAADTNVANFTDIVGSHGYPTEIHEVETEDGYLLDVYRVPSSPKIGTKSANSFPVLINHGLMGSAENFIIGGPSKALAYVLADKGYDVWFCNARGSWHSRKHKTMDPDRDLHQFWRFSWHEIGYYDLPATIDYILNVTQKSKLHYIGHSQGTTTFFALMADKPEYNEKIHVMLALAPSALLEHIKDPSLKFLAPTYRYLQSLAESFEIYELVPKRLLSHEAIRAIISSLCDSKSATRIICMNVFVAMSGFSEEQLDPNTIPLIIQTGPAGASLYQVLHYAQLVNTGKFIKYDWSPKENLLKYNSTVPPEYNLGHVTCPVALFYGDADLLTTKEDVAILATRLPNVVDVYRVPYDNWSHMDFLWAKDVDKLLNKHLLRVLRKFR